MSEVRPALTPEEWAKKGDAPDVEVVRDKVRMWKHGPNEFDNEVGVSSVTEGRSEVAYVHAADLHALAALALHGQPWAFTWADVDLLRLLADMIAGHDTSITEPEDAGPLRELADRIAALLPPR